MVDIPKLVTTAQRLLAANGRAMVIKKYDATVTDSSKPWNAGTDSLGTPAATISLYGVNVSPVDGTSLGLSVNAMESIMQNAQKMLMISPGTGVDLNGYSIVEDEGEDWRIEGMEILRPGSETALAFLGVAR